MDGSGELRRVMPESGEFPGWHYGDLVFAPERQDRLPHAHDFYEICIVRKGVAIHRTDFGDDRLVPGTVVVIAPRIAHAIYGERGLWQTNVYYLAEWLSDDLGAYWNQSALVPLFLAAALFRGPFHHAVPQFSLSNEELDSIDHELTDIGRECDSEHPSQAFLKSSLMKLLIKLSRAYARGANEEVGLRFREEIVQAVELIEQLILQCEPFNVASLAKKAGVSPGHFSALFREATGWPPSDYYQRRRVQHASRLLLNPRRTITNVAHELGYYDAAHLCHFFKQHQKMSATEYRKQCSGQTHAPTPCGTPKQVP
jgi:AraC-like DNA-binding protein